MKCNVSIPERMKDLRVERHLSLEELEAAVGISKSALGSYESTEGCKEINHGSILKLADFYQVSTDYLLCRTDNRNPENIELTELHINDEVVEASNTLIARSAAASGCASSIIARTAASELFMSWKRMVAIPST